ncbi:MAG: bifunctional phosphopantothenoylcysteine decarboxylase/phosphopantothenate--cysteine ligase CoaBC [Chitinophagales bacterium]|nr:bifunctional phosphopantothenoylcysteine decarboxylase/phosphopantothenate--cysteine ligase CoaBC [Chitinophagales bacterium]MDW8428704.1 bifunctional phosphopantothenoylcysteine decarboxylase/phosphopantothenate--cysteine ligase CoaBC [Chitinophagales bacterium]
MVQGKKVIVGVTGSIAAYKSAFLVRALIRKGAHVRVVMTPAAEQFIPPITLATLSRHPVLRDLADASGQTWNNHIELARWADVLVIAPLSANTLAKLAHGLCDNLLTAVYLSARCPVVLAPAMDEDMWLHAATQANVTTLLQRNHHIVPVEHGELASGLVGMGRMAEPENIVAFLEDLFQKKTQPSPLDGLAALVTAGPTFEPIDPVRFIGNYSTGKMGIALAEALLEHGAHVTLILGPSVEPVPASNQLKVIRVHTADEMYQQTLRFFPQAKITIMAAAVADYTPAQPAASKLKKLEHESMTLTLRPTTDILHELGQLKQPGQVLVGFALETDYEFDNALQKLYKKNLDFIVLNSLRDPGAGFGHDTNRITIIDRNGQSLAFPLKTKREAAQDIVNFVATLLKSSAASE